MCCIIFSELKKLNAKFFGKVRIVTQNIFSHKVWFQVLISQRIFYENVISAQKLSIKFGSVFNFHARFFGNNFNKFLSEKNRGKAFSVSSENMLHTTFWGFVSGGVKDALTFGLRLMFVDITEP